jgi:ATP-dependent exoDNAse (exonuclease V) alpha subunit
LVNGLRGEVTAIAPDDRGLQLRLRSGRLLTVSSDALRAGALDHGYALTVHRAQGVTVDVALLFASQALTREAGYVAMSRGRESNALYTTWDAMSPDQPDDDISIRAADPVRNTERSELTDAALVARFESRRAQHLAISQLDPSRTRRSHERHRSPVERDPRRHGRGA